MSDWQPIETAPKDGTQILACGFRDGVPIIRTTRWRTLDGGLECWGEFNTYYWPATHWMPLPKPPAIRKEAADEIDSLREQLVKAKAMLREFLPAAVAGDARNRAAAFLTDETGK